LRFPSSVATGYASAVGGRQRKSMWLVCHALKSVITRLDNRQYYLLILINALADSAGDAKAQIG
jgi:hypothetical protein